MKFKLKSTILVVFLFLFLRSSFGSDYQKDTAQINNWLNQSKKLLYTHPDTANIILDSILKKSDQINYRNGLYSAYKQRGVAYFMTGQFEESIKQSNSALKYANPDNAIERIRIFVNISYSLRKLNLIDSSLIYSEKVLKIARENQIDDIYQQTILDLAYSYMEKENYAKSAKYYHEVIEDVKNTSDKEYIVKSYSSLALFYYRLENFKISKKYFELAIDSDLNYSEIDFLSVNYANLGLLYQQVKNDYDSAIYFFKKSLDYTQEFDRERKELIAEINIGNCLYEQDLYDSAYKHYKVAIESPLIDNYPLYQAAVYTNVGKYYLKKEYYDKAKEHLKKGLNISLKIEHLEFQQQAYYSLYILDSIQHNHAKALYSFQEYHRVSNLRNTQKVSHQMALLDYEKYLATERINNELLTKENKNQYQQIIIQRTIIGIVIILVLVLVNITILISKNRKKIKLLNANLEKSNKNLGQLNSELTSQKQEMKELLMSKDRFVSILGHDLKNPFTGLLGLLEIMQEDWDEIPDAEKRDSIKQLHKSSIQTYQLLEDLLDWGKTQQGLISVSKSIFPMAELIQEIQNIYHIHLKDKKIQLKYNIPNNLQLNTDKKLLSQIIQNFVGNAIKYSYPGNKILIDVIEEEKQTKICITDYGIGIPEDKIDSLFDLDQYFNRPGTQNEKSTGMGLILCKEYAKILDATISVSSKVDSGSTFCLMLPRQ